MLSLSKHEQVNTHPHTSMGSVRGCFSSSFCHGPRKRATQANIKLIYRVDTRDLAGPIESGHDNGLKAQVSNLWIPFPRPASLGSPARTGVLPPNLLHALHVRNIVAWPSRVFVRCLGTPRRSGAWGRIWPSHYAWLFPSRFLAYTTAHWYEFACIGERLSRLDDRSAAWLG